jgi:hypothetical protein
MADPKEYQNTDQFKAQQKFLQTYSDEFLKHSRERQSINIV